MGLGEWSCWGKERIVVLEGDEMRVKDIWNGKMGRGVWKGGG